MNSLFSRSLLMAALLTVINVATASDGLLSIETSPTQLIDEGQPATEMGHSPEIRVEHGDILKLETNTQPTTKPMQMQMELELIEIKLPVRGMNKSAVAAEFGEPLNRSPAVGMPPISSWDYPEYTVYFEYEWVLHSVLNSKK